MLDVSIRVAVLDLLLSLREEQGLSYVFISHDFGVVRYMARGGKIIVMFFGVIVEEGPAEEVIQRPRHPYSYVLLEAIPIPDPKTARRRRAEIAAAEIDERADQPPAEEGCIFSNRCPFAEDVCRTTRPPLTEVGPGHRAACLFPERVPQLSGVVPVDAQL
jgi:oligopeptide/dipeptide ABC transporter ATP-binding protein